MKKLSALLGSIFLLVVAASPALAATKVTIGNNGADSYNRVDVYSYLKNKYSQSNVTEVVNAVEIKADTGDNEANKNTGVEEVSVDTGGIYTGIGIKNKGNTNYLSDDCGCPEDEANVKIKYNGADSVNKVKLSSMTSSYKTQMNLSSKLNALKLKLDTGDNEANKNTGGGDGDPSVGTGPIETAIEIINGGDENVLE